MAQENYMDELRKPPVPKILRISEAAKVLRGFPSANSTTF